VWRGALDLLEDDPRSLAATLDWAIKRSVYGSHTEESGRDLNAPDAALLPAEDDSDEVPAKARHWIGDRATSRRHEVALAWVDAEGELRIRPFSTQSSELQQAWRTIPTGRGKLTPDLVRQAGFHLLSQARSPRRRMLLVTPEADPTWLEPFQEVRRLGTAVISP